MSIRIAFCCAFVAALAVTCESARAADYDVVDLGILPSFNSANPGYQSIGYGIDNAGHAAGRSDMYVNNASVAHGFYWNGTTLSDMDSASSTANTFALGMSPDGKVVGAKGIGFAFYWSPGGGFTNLSPLGGTSGNAYGMNTAGDVVGSSVGALTYATVWKSGTTSPTQLSPYGSLFYATAEGINNAKTIAGYSFGPGSDVATIWNYSSGTGTWSPQSLGTLGGSGSDALDINTAGNVVGNASRAGGQGVGAFIWHPGDAAVTDLDPTRTFFGANTFAKGINDHNQVVGSKGGGGAFVWDSTNGIRDLQTLIDPSSPFSLTDAKDVNDNGWIVGTAHDSNDNFSHAVILKPAALLLPGDLNRDNHVNAADIPTMMLAMTNPSVYKSTYNVDDSQLQILANINQDGVVNNADIQSLLTLLKTGGGSAEGVPEPSTIALLTLGGLALVFRRRRRGFRLLPPGGRELFSDLSNNCVNLEGRQ
jgi:uncharacterized membrane protein